MKNILTILLLLTISLMACDNTSKQPTSEPDSKIQALLEQMTLEEKIGQMKQVNGFNGQITDDLKADIIAGKVGSILNEVNVETVNEIQRIAMEESRLGIPVIIGRDVIHGFKTIFPIPLGQAATWNPEIAKQGARIAAMEAWSSGVNWTFAPMIDISRDARWGRIAESCGEDPFLTSVMGAAMIEGFQGEKLSDDGSILACAKHFAGYGAAEGGRDYNTTLIPEVELRNIYLPPFKAATEAGVGSFMSGFNDLNGVPATGNKFLLRNVLRDEWNFDGFVVSDWASITEMIAHGFAADEKDAAQKAIIAGVDMEMATTSYEDHLKELIDEGAIDEKLLDEAVFNILKIKYELGLFDDPYVKAEDQNQFGLPEYLDAAKKAAIESMVLLKNDKNILPFRNDIKKLALIGPMANQKYEQLGTWIFDGDRNLSVTPLDALQEKFGKDKILFAEGLAYSRSKDKSKFKEAINIAKQSDVVVMCMGEEAIISGEAHCRASIELPGAQNELIKEIAKTGKPIVLVILAGRPLAIGPEVNLANSVLYAFHTGTMTGAALCELLMGEVSPSGKLPVTFPKTSGQIPIYYNKKNTGRPVDPNNWMSIDDIPLNTYQTSLGNTSHYLDLGYEPLFNFGYGLTYTRFQYSNLVLSGKELVMDGQLEITVDIQNTGNYEAKEVVQLYVRDKVGSITRPVKELKGFQKIHLKPGEIKTVTFEIKPEDLKFYNGENYLAEPGDFDIWVGPNSVEGLHSIFVLK